MWDHGAKVAQGRCVSAHNVRLIEMLSFLNQSDLVFRQIDFQRFQAYFHLIRVGPYYPLAHLLRPPATTDMGIYFRLMPHQKPSFFTL